MGREKKKKASALLVLDENKLRIEIICVASRKLETGGKVFICRRKINNKKAAVGYFRKSNCTTRGKNVTWCFMLSV